MNKSIRLLLSFLSVLLFFSCSNNLKSSSLVISFNLQNQKNQKNQNVQRTATNQENLNVTVTLYDVLTTENNLQNLADFKIIETQTVPIVNNKALVQIDNVQIGTNALITAQITQNNQTLYEGKSEIFTVSEGKNHVKIQLKKVSSSEPENPENSDDENINDENINDENTNDENINDDNTNDDNTNDDNTNDDNTNDDNTNDDNTNDDNTNDENIPEDDIPPEHIQNPVEQENTISVTVQLPNDVSFNISVSKKEDASINIQIPNLPEGYQIDKVLVDGKTLENGDYSCSDFAAVDVLFITVVIKDEQGNCYSKEIQYSVEKIKL